jgi:hypothetical protein
MATRLHVSLSEKKEGVGERVTTTAEQARRRRGSRPQPPGLDARAHRGVDAGAILSNEMSSASPVELFIELK